MINSKRNAQRYGDKFCHRVCEKPLENKVIRQREKREWKNRWE